MTAFPNAYFEKDNDAKSGSKGDFIFRDYDNGTEFISLMFEMKNEADATATKHKNEHFFKELDKDRTDYFNLSFLFRLASLKQRSCVCHLWQLVSRLLSAGKRGHLGL